jgi:hypothetical protein
MDDMMPQSHALADLAGVELRGRLEFWAYWRDEWNNARRYGLLSYRCEGEIVEVLLSAGVAEAERQLSVLREDAGRRSIMRGGVREVQP